MIVRLAAPSRARSRTAALALLAVLAAAAGVRAALAPAATPPPILASGDQVPAIDTLGLDGSRKRISFESGTTVLLFFMSSCPTCHKMIPRWNRAYLRRAEGLEVIGILVDREPPGFFVATPISFPVVRSPGRAILRTHYKVFQVPLTLRVAAGGRVEEVGAGLLDGIRLGEILRPPGS